MRFTKRRAAAACLAGIAGLSLTACSSSKSAGSSSTTSAGSNSTSGGSSLATIAPNAKVTGTLSGPGVTASTITIGQIATITGPVPGLFQGADNGLDAWADWVNSNGGIDGRQVKIDHVDDGFNCTTYTNAMKQFETSAFAVLGNVTLEDTCGKGPLAGDPNLIDIQALVLDPTLYSVANVFAGWPTPPGGLTTGLQYIAKKYPGIQLKAAQLTGQSAAANGKEEALTAESVGYKYVYSRVIGDFETNFTSDILRMKNAGVQFVDLTDVAVTDDANFLQQAAQQNFHPKVVYGASGYDAQLFKLLGNASLANDEMWAAVPDSLYLGQDAATVPAVNTFDTWLKNAHPSATADLYAVEAWAAGQLLVQAMQNAGSSVTPATVISAIRNVKSYDSQGLISPTDPGDKTGGHCVVLANVQNGQWVRVQPSSGFDCSGTYHNVPLSAVSS